VIQNLQGIILNSDEILQDLKQRFEYPLFFELSNNAKLFGQNGIRVDFVKGKSIQTAIVGENLELCFK